MELCSLFRQNHFIYICCIAVFLIALTTTCVSVQVDISECIPSNSMLALSGKCECYNEGRGVRNCGVSNQIDLVCTDLMTLGEGEVFLNVTCL